MHRHVAVVWGVITASILAGSRFMVARLISTNTGRILFQSNECAVATKEYRGRDDFTRDAQRLQCGDERDRAVGERGQVIDAQVIA